MKLSDEEQKLFLKLHPMLGLYAAQRMKKYRTLSTLNDYMDLPLENKLEIREYLTENLNIIDSFVEENPAGLSKEELEIVREWKHCVKGRFYVIKYLKKYTVFLEAEKGEFAYGVVGLTDEIEDIIGSHLPRMVEAVLLPFMGKIVHDGVFNAYNVIFGGVMRRQLNTHYQKAKSRYGIITTLPFEPEKKEESPEELLRFYMKSNKNLEMYVEEIRDLLDKHPELENIFYHELGRLSSKQVRKRLKEMGVRNAWYGIIEDAIVAGARTEDELMEILREILPPEKFERVYLFRIK